MSILSRNYLVKHEKQTGKYRLLIFDSELPKTTKSQVIIDNKRYTTVIVYDLPNSIAILCDENTPTLIGQNVIFD